jgi:phospholipid-binding lipoprotein MlaA
MRILCTFLITLLLCLPANADEISYNFDYSLNDKADSNCSDLDDPFEKVNRKIFYFNSFVDYITLKPLAKLYGRTFNDYTKDRVGDFVDNVREPLTTVNYGLQGDLDNLISSFWRFAINSTFGVGGTYDLATDLGIKKKTQTFGSTLAHYGVSPGPYIQIPLIGGSNLRDMWDVIILDSALNPLMFPIHADAKNIYTGTRLIHKRNEIMPFTDYLAKTSTDPYAAIRAALHQRREATIHYPEGYVCGKRPKK